MSSIRMSACDLCPNGEGADAWSAGSPRIKRDGLGCWRGPCLHWLEGSPPRGRPPGSNGAPIGNASKSLTGKAESVKAKERGPPDVLEGSSRPLFLSLLPPRQRAKGSALPGDGQREQRSRTKSTRCERSPSTPFPSRFSAVFILRGDYEAVAQKSREENWRESSVSRRTGRSTTVSTGCGKATNLWPRRRTVFPPT